MADFWYPFMRLRNEPGSVNINGDEFRTRPCPYPSVGIEVQLVEREWTWFSVSALARIAKLSKPTQRWECDRRQGDAPNA